MYLSWTSRSVHNETRQVLPSTSWRETVRSLGWTSQSRRSSASARVGLGPDGAIPISEAIYQEAVDVHRPTLQAACQDYFSQHQFNAIIFLAWPLKAHTLKSSWTASKRMAAKVIEKQPPCNPFAPNSIQDVDAIEVLYHHLFYVMSQYSHR